MKVSEETIDVAELSLERIVVGAILGDHGSRVLAVAGHLETFILLELVVAEASPLDQVLARLKHRSPSNLEEVVVLQLESLLHGNFLLDSGGVEVESAISEESVPFLSELGVIILDVEALGLHAALKNGVLRTFNLLSVSLGGVFLLFVGTHFENRHKLTVEDFIADGSAHLLLKLLLVQHLIN